MNNSMGSLKLWNDKPLAVKVMAKLRAAASLDLTVAARIDRTNPNDPRSFGIDVSYWNGAIDWTAVKAYSPKIVYTGIRASVGLTYKDSRFAAHMAGAKA